ncbi:esterase [Paenibacillus sp. HWE-109]|uniref:alpha/beta hydrolase n=1 Tax=Paenibacillus sp. HWE-109 TaxID=1306526 RepID=UPI001EE0C56F|nr:alpha/beta hydrolase-fold protein [Paenibacillus sp. HWE-109]UKS26959.1 esterase [Paenibacillus sp. HWE-109]
MESKSSILRVENFHSTHLGNKRDIFVYLPPSYRYEQKKKYPVLYMHDGQNIFHAAFNGYSWHVNKTVDRLIQNHTLEEIIVVGIPNMGAERADEFTHELEGVLYHSDKIQIKPKGHLYEAFMIEELKPYVDSVFRTLTGPDHTALMGSSRGGQVTYHIGFRRPDIFGKLAIVSPYFYCVDPLTLEEAPVYHTFGKKQSTSHIWMDLGGSEGTLVMEKHVREVAEKLLDLGYEADKEFIYFNAPGAVHSEKDWAKRVGSPLLHFFGTKGKECSLSLHGSEEVGLTGPECRLNPILAFDTGFQMSLLRTTYEVEDRGILNVLDDGTVVPLEEGETTVTVKYQDLEAAKSIRVVNAQKECVTLEMVVHVPVDTPEDIKVYAWFPFVYDPDSHTYAKQLQVPLQAEFVYQISREDGSFEVDHTGKPVQHQYKALSDSKVEIKVEYWS